eukprot:364620-Chlamydomonas_euryale.AAC.14
MHGKDAVAGQHSCRGAGQPPAGVKSGDTWLNTHTRLADEHRLLLVTSTALPVLVSVRSQPCRWPWQCMAQLQSRHVPHALKEPNSGAGMSPAQCSLHSSSWFTERPGLLQNSCVSAIPNQPHAQLNPKPHRCHTHVNATDASMKREHAPSVTAGARDRHACGS